MMIYLGAQMKQQKSGQQINSADAVYRAADFCVERQLSQPDYSRFGSNPAVA